MSWSFLKTAAKVGGKGAVEAEEEAAALASKGIKRPLGKRLVGGGSTAVGALGATGTVLAGGAAAYEAYEGFEDLKQMAGFFKFLMECVSDPQHIGKHLNDWMAGKSDEKNPEKPAVGDNLSHSGNSAAREQTGVKLDDVSSAGAAKALSVTATRPGEPRMTTVATGGEAIDVKDHAGMTQRREIANATAGTLGGAYAEAWKQGGEPGKVFEIKSKAGNGGDIVERVAALDKDHFVLLKNGLGSGYGVTPFQGAEGQKKLDGLREDLASGRMETATGLGSVYDARDHMSVGSSIRFGAAMGDNDRSRLNAALSPMGDFSVSGKESGLFRAGPDSQTRGEFISVGGEPRLEFIGGSGQKASIGGSNGEMIEMSLPSEGNFTRSAFISGAPGVKLEASGKLSVSEEAGKILETAGKTVGARSLLELEAASAGVTRGETTAIMDGKGRIVGQTMTFVGEDGRQGAVALQNGRAIYVDDKGEKRVVEDSGLKVNEKTGAIELGKETADLRGFLKSPDLEAVKTKGVTAEIGASPAAYIESLKRGDTIGLKPAGDRSKEAQVKIARKDEERDF